MTKNKKKSTCEEKKKNGKNKGRDESRDGKDDNQAYTDTCHQNI